MLDATLQIAARCDFKLSEISYHYPQESVLPGMDARQTLAWHTWQGAAGRYPAGISQKGRQQMHNQVELIFMCGYEMYFLTVHEHVRFAPDHDNLCHGRGSGAD